MTSLFPLGWLIPWPSQGDITRESASPGRVTSFASQLVEPDRRRRWAGRLMRNPDVLRATFGGHLIEVDHGGVVLQGLRWHAFR